MIGGKVLDNSALAAPVGHVVHIARQRGWSALTTDPSSVSCAQERGWPLLTARPAQYAPYEYEQTGGGLEPLP